MKVGELTENSRFCTSISHFPMLYDKSNELHYASSTTVEFPFSTEYTMYFLLEKFAAERFVIFIYYYMQMSFWESNRVDGFFLPGQLQTFTNWISVLESLNEDRSVFPSVRPPVVIGR